MDWKDINPIMVGDVVYSAKHGYMVCVDYSSVGRYYCRSVTKLAPEHVRRPPLFMHRTDIVRKNKATLGPPIAALVMEAELMGWMP